MNSEPNTTITDVYRYPFSLFNETKHHEGVKRVGNVEDMMDKNLGRQVIRITGSVSANNYIEFKNLHLTGSYVYIQMKVLTKVATIHIEVITTSGLSIRFTLSTLYENDKPRFFGRSLRLPIPSESTWMIVALDINAILKKYCITSGSECHELNHIKKIQICSNVIIRDIVTNSKPISSSVDHLPRELAAKSKQDSNFVWFDNFGSNIAQPLNSPQQLDGKKTLSSNIASHPKENDYNDTNLHSESRPLFHDTISNQNTSVTIDKITQNVVSVQSVNNRENPITKSYEKLQYSVTPKKTVGNTIHPVSVATKASGASYIALDVTKTEKVLSLDKTLGYQGGPMAYLYGGSMVIHSCGKSLILLDISETVEPVEKEKGFWKLFRQSSNVSSYNQQFMSPMTVGSLNNNSMRVEDMSQTQVIVKGHTNPVSHIELSGNEELMITCENGTNCKIILWNMNDGKKLFTLQNTHSSICATAFSNDCSMLATVGIDQQNRVQIVVWDIDVLLLEQSKIIDVVNATRLQSSSSATPSSSSIISEKTHDPLNKYISDSGRAIAKQLSDFPITSISFCPFEENSLISCGRENIRFWRLRKKHLPGRPVLLGEYSRGYIFNHIAYYNIPGSTASDSRQSCVYFSSNKGIILKVNYFKEQVLCAYQLHSSSITSFIITHGYAVTGASDNKLRVWPLDFSDFLMEAQHEGTVSNIKVTKDGSHLLVGTRAGTVGVLVIAEHSYKTILRSHTNTIHQIAKRGAGEEFATVGSDNTIRVWDLFTAQQKFEFSSSLDEPKSVTYHPTFNIIACGFESGNVRVFDINTTSTLFEKKHHKSSVSSVEYLPIKLQRDFYDDSDSPFKSSLYASIHLVSVSMDGIMVIYDADNKYEPLKSFSIQPSIPGSSIRLSYNMDYNILAVSTGSLASLIVMNMNDYSFLFKGGQLLVNGQLQSIRKSTIGGDSESSPIKSPSKSPLSIRKPLDIFISTDLDSIIHGISFSRDSSGFNHLLVAMDKHLVQIPLFGDSVDDQYLQLLRSFTPDISSKRIDFGTPRNLLHDSISGFTIIPVVLNKESRKELYSNNGNSSYNKLLPYMDQKEDKVDLSILGISSKRSSNTLKIQMSLSQVYDNHPGSITDAILCLSHGKVVTVDDFGTMIFWNVKHDKINRLRLNDSPSSVDETTVNVDVGTRRVRIDETYHEHSMALEALEITNLRDHDGHDGNNNNNSHTQLMINEFETLVGKDPSMWSAATIDTMSPASYRIGEGFPTVSNHAMDDIVSELPSSPSYAVKSTTGNNEQARLEDMFLNEEDMILNSPTDVFKNLHNDINTDQNVDVNDKYIYDTETPVKSLPMEENTSITSGSSSVNNNKKKDYLSVVNNNNPSSVSHLIEGLDDGFPMLNQDIFDDKRFQSPSKDISGRDISRAEDNFMGSPLYADNPGICFDDSDPFDEKIPSFRFTSSSNTVSPEYNAAYRELLMSDGTSIIVKNMESLSDHLLPEIPGNQKDLGFVCNLSFSSSGNIIIAIFRNEKEVTEEGCTHYLIAWNRSSSSSSGLSWNSACAARLRAPIGSSISGVTLSWITIGNEEYVSLLMVLEPIDQTVESALDSRKMMLSLLSRSNILKGTISEQIIQNTDFFSIIASQTVSGDYKLGGSHILSKLVDITNTNDSNLSSLSFGLITWIDNKFYCFEVTKCNEKFTYRVFWTDDFGTRGPIVNVSKPSVCDRFSELAILDSYGDLRFVIFHNTLGIRSVALSIDTSHIGGNPISVSVSNIQDDVIWKAKWPTRVLASSSSFLNKDSVSSFYFSQVVIAHKHEVKVFSVVVKEVHQKKGLVPYLEVKLHYLYNVKTANVKIDYLSLIIMDQQLPIRRDRYHLPSSQLFAGSENSIVSAWNLDIITANHEGFVGIISTKPSKYPSTPQEVVTSAVVQSNNIFPYDCITFVNFGLTKKYSAYLDSSMKVTIVENMRKTKVKGVFYCLHNNSNGFIKFLVCDTTILKSVTAIAGCSSYLALGSTKGHLLLLDGATISPICQYSDSGSHDLTRGESMAVSIDASSSKVRRSVSESMIKSTIVLPTLTEDMIVSLLFIRNGKSIVAINAKNEVFLYYISSKEDGRDTLIEKYTIQSTISTVTSIAVNEGEKVLRDQDQDSSPLMTCSCYKSSNIFGLFHIGSNSIEILRAKTSPSYFDSSQVGLTLGIVTLTSDSCDILIYEAHAIKSGELDGITLYVHGKKEEELSSHGIYKAEIVLPFHSHLKQSIVCTQIIYLKAPVRCVFSEHLCGVIEENNICAYDLTKFESDSLCIYDLAKDDVLIKNEFFRKALVSFEHSKRGGNRTDAIQVLFHHPSCMIQSQLSYE